MRSNLDNTRQAVEGEADSGRAHVKAPYRGASFSRWGVLRSKRWADIRRYADCIESWPIWHQMKELTKEQTG